MIRALKLKAPAKINLRLEVAGKRRDGYHLLRMINVPVSLYDSIEIRINNSGVIELLCVHPDVPSGKTNLAYRAAEAVKEVSGDKSLGASIKLRKKIPVAAGLGGGSSDAVAVLKGMTEALNLDIPGERLLKLALGLGADVPFFMSSGPAVVTGIGENIETITGFPEWHYLLMTPSFKVSTREVFEMYKLRRFKGRPEIKETMKKYRAGRAYSEMFINDLERVVFSRHPEVARLKETLLELGADGAVMSGSGPTVVGIFENEQEARRVKRRIGKLYPGCTAHVTAMAESED